LDSCNWRRLRRSVRSQSCCGAAAVVGLRRVSFLTYNFNFLAWRLRLGLGCSAVSFGAELARCCFRLKWPCFLDFCLFDGIQMAVLDLLPAAWECRDLLCTSQSKGLQRSCEIVSL
jgi:hypothetical protein